MPAAPAEHTLSEEQWWAFDTLGFLLIPATVTAPIEAIAAQLCGGGECVVDHAADSFAPGVLGGNECLAPTRRRDRYWSYGEGRLVGTHRLIALTALQDTDAVELVLASHRAEVAPPAALLRNQTKRSYFEVQQLSRGDVLLIAGGVLRRFRAGAERLLQSVEYVSGQAPPPAIAVGEQDMPDWVRTLSDTQRALLWPYRQTGTAAAPLVLSDGQKTWLGEEAVATATGVHNGADAAHPSLLRLDPTSAIDEEEMFWFDCNGYLVIRRVMDDGWLQQARDAVEANLGQVFLRGIGHDNDGSLGVSEGPLAGTGRPDLKGLFQLPNGHAAPFLRMLDHPAVIQRLNWLLGAGYIAEQNTAICSVKGSSGQRLHAGGAPGSPMGTYEVRGGRIFIQGSINVVWQLHDVREPDGGFVINPGSHRATFPLPDRVAWCHDQTAVRHVAANAGDVVLFLGSAVTHGALPWRSEKPRRVAILSYFSKYSRLYGAKL